GGRRARGLREVGAEGRRGRNRRIPRHDLAWRRASGGSGEDLRLAALQGRAFRDRVDDSGAEGGRELASRPAARAACPGHERGLRRRHPPREGQARLAPGAGRAGRPAGFQARRSLKRDKSVTATVRWPCRRLFVVATDNEGSFMKGIFLAAAVTVAVAVAGVALAQDSGDTTVIHACKHPSGGWLRQVLASTQCRRREGG